MVASTEPKKHAEPPGKRALLDAAERLAASSRCVTSLGLRELAREAGLNPNTFYRHFRDMEDLGLQLLRQSKSELRSALRALRRQAARAERPQRPLDWLISSQRPRSRESIVIVKRFACLFAKKLARRYVRCAPNSGVAWGV